MRQRICRNILTLAVINDNVEGDRQPEKLFKKIKFERLWRNLIKGIIEDGVSIHKENTILPASATTRHVVFCDICTSFQPGLRFCSQCSQN